MVGDVRSDELERRVQSLARQQHMTQEGWMELLDATIPKLKRRRKLLNIHKATRLAYVMGLVGSKRDAPLASLAVAALLVDHWCPNDCYAFLQKDAMRHATVAFLRAEMRDPWDKENIARQLELGVRSALDGVGLEHLRTFPAWSRDSHILFPGGAEVLQDEVDDLASDCRDSQSDSVALVMLQQYVAVKRLDTFFEDFIEWGKGQLDNLPETMLDEATLKHPAPPSSEPARSKAESRGAMEGSRNNRARAPGGGGGANGGASGDGRGNNRDQQRSTRKSPPGSKQTNPKKSRSSNGSTSTSSNSTTSDSGNSRGSKSVGGGKGSSRDEGGGVGRGKGGGTGRGTSKGLGVNKQRITIPRFATASKSGSRSMPAPARVNGSRDFSDVSSDCPRDSSSGAEDCSFGSGDEGGEEREEDGPRLTKRLKASILNASVNVEGETKGGRKAAAAARIKMKAQAGDGGATGIPARPSSRGGKPATAPTTPEVRRASPKGKMVVGPATYRMGDTDEGIPASSPRRMLQVIHAITRDGGGVSGYFDRIPEVIASLRRLVLSDLDQQELASETAECEIFLRASFASALCTSGTSEGYEFLPLVKYVLQEAYEGPESMNVKKLHTLMSNMCVENRTIAEEFPRFSFFKLSASTSSRVVFVIKKR